MWQYTPSYIATILLGCHVTATKEDLTVSEIAGITTGVGIAGGFGIGCVHELIHRPALLDLTCGIVACVFANYSHFWIEHLWGHHKRVATDEDPASSNLGDDLYKFLVRCIYKSFVDAIDSPGLRHIRRPLESPQGAQPTNWTARSSREVR